jgi:nifR3 family TIM-barrel protein
MLTLGTLKLENWLVLAPMSGRTNLPFRLIAKQWGAGLVITEMISAAGLWRGQEKTHAYFKSHPDERPVSVQFFGSELEAMAMSVGIAAEKGMDGVDINMGCPARKVVKSGAGAALMRDPQKVGKIISTLRRTTPLPLTVKIRAGWSPEEANALNIARIAEDNGADGIFVHPRFANQGFSGRADWTVIAKVKRALKIPVIGSGDVTEPALALRMRSDTNCDGVMIGRAALSSPWIFKQVLEMERNGHFTIPSLEERYRVVKEHYSLLLEHLGEKRATAIMRGFLLWYTKSLPNRSFLKSVISEIKGKEGFVAVMDEYFGSIQEGIGREG